MKMLDEPVMIDVFGFTYFLFGVFSPANSKCYAMQGGATNLTFTNNLAPIHDIGNLTILDIS